MKTLKKSTGRKESRELAGMFYRPGYLTTVAPRDKNGRYMARPSKLSDAQLREIEQRMLSGEAGCALAREFGVTYNAIKKRLSARVNQTKQVANQLIAAEDALAALPPGAQLNALNLAAKLRAISNNLAEAAHNGAIAAGNISRIVKDESARLADRAKAAALVGNSAMSDSESIVVLRGMDLLNGVMNDSAELGLSLIKASKEVAKDDDDVPPLPRTISVNTVDAA